MRKYLPTSKVTAATGAGAAAVVVLGLIDQFLGTSFSELVDQVLVVVVAFAGGWLKSENRAVPKAKSSKRSG